MHVSRFIEEIGTFEVLVKSYFSFIFIAILQWSSFYFTLTGKKFVIEDLDETHVFVSAEIVPVLQEKVWEIMDNNSFNISQNS